jgi:competence protein ComEC
LSALAVALVPTRHKVQTVERLRAALSFARLLVCAAGLAASAAQLRAQLRPDATRQAPVESARVEGYVIDRDRSAGRLRLTLRLTAFTAEGFASASPRRIRISLPERQSAFLGPGRHIACPVSLAPPASPLAPGSYDFQRRSFFEGLDAVGYARGACAPLPATARLSGLQRAGLWLAAVRADIAAEIVAIAPSQGGALAAAMIVGDRSFMAEETNDALRDAGLAHIVSVSGLHMAIVGGFIFFVLKRGLALIPWLALRLPVAKIAAAGSLLALGLYLALSGSSVPAQRAAIMAGVAFGAILLDRPAISMRGLGVAAALIVLLDPNAVVEPGFQMSFMATLALVAAYELLATPNGPRGSPGPLIGTLQAAAGAMTAAVVTSGVAGAATELFSIQHFQRLTLYGLPVNLAASPLIALLVAPAAVIAGVVAPFGLADAPLQLMAAALDVILAFAQAFAAMPEAVQPIPPFAPAAFVAFAAALVWACLWRGALRLGAVPLLAVGIAAQAAAGPIVAVFSADFTHVYARSDTNRTQALPAGRERAFERDRLLALTGAYPKDARQGLQVQGCTPQASCSLNLAHGGQVIWLPQAPDGPSHTAAPPCPTAAQATPSTSPTLLFSPTALPARWESACPGLLILDATHRAGRGGVVRQSPWGLHVNWSDSQTSNRPWRRSAGLRVPTDE